MQRVADHIWALLSPVVESMGVEFVGAQFGQAENGQTLRVFIDKPEGIHVEDCALVSRQLSALLDVEDVIAGEYLLEVSSPGIDRPLFNAAQFQNVLGQQVKVKLLAPLASVDGGSRRNFKGELLAVNDADSETNASIDIEVDGEVYSLPLVSVEAAKVVPVY